MIKKHWERQNVKTGLVLCGLLLWLITITSVKAQQMDISSVNVKGHPRLLADESTGRDKLNALIKNEGWATTTFNQIWADADANVSRYQTDSTWMSSRLQMYWKQHYTDVFIKNGIYAYATGHALVPTVRFTGTRDAATQYIRPKLEDIKPHMDEYGKLYLQNGTVPGKPWEWVEQSKTGRIIESINIEIIEKARNAAMLYWLTGDEKYAAFAYSILDPYITGMGYRNEPVDLNHGHDQTLVGLSAFEVIHEDVLEPLTAGYDFLFPYIKKHHPEKLPVYAVTFKKWADLIIKNGVPFNNWDLIEAKFVADIAIILENDNQYADKRGCQYYLDQILNKTSTRQWSLTTLLKGYDPVMAIWGECPGYSQNVIADFTGFVNLFDRTLHTDLLKQIPVLPKAVLAYAQYLYPNGYIVGFGDTHYGKLRTDAISDLIRNARVNNKAGQEAIYSRMLKTMNAIAQKESSETAMRPMGFNALFGNPPITIPDTVKEGLPGDYLTATFWSPNVSWMVQRNGLDVNTGLMISQAGSSGNHMHANGIAMELYGRGIVLAPEGGIGGSYFQTDYAEYYSQFPAHNTVVVDGISSYPAMKSNHPLKLNACYPQSAQKAGYFKGITFSDVSFLEPETNADQNRLMSIIRTGDSTGYYVDIFRSRRKDGKDKTHDYIYHNLGQQVTLSDNNNKPFNIRPTEKLTFANTELVGYDYFYDKKSIQTDHDFKARFNLGIPGRDSIFMNMWMKGYADREVFSVKAPPSKAWRKNEMIPDSIANMPLPTVVVRQTGEAWSRPFAAIYEPSGAANNGTAIKSISSFGNEPGFTGLIVNNKSGQNDYIFAHAETQQVGFQDMQFKGLYGVISITGNKLVRLFLGKGVSITRSGYSLTSSQLVSAALWLEQGKLHFTADHPVKLYLPAGILPAHHTITLNNVTIKGELVNQGGNKQWCFSMPASTDAEIVLN
ncbi:heparinase II/III family protein [Mucilaginibacter sp. cycad4]|uniref:heparinase II/III domain-containing protein n=1 Tax=Mucilaginibacter sp. cycad4 TaxID=3342096 RepID=UPI002AAB2ABD|nr:heparinase II/III family protein [Mucilaginibacter gossypii]WPV00683.1 heparinase II/III family protein [Mucilaginibacter gossypii]